MAPNRLPQPASLKPQLATLVEHPPAGDWHYEIKFDGYRMLARVDKGEVKLFTRNGHDWTAKLPELAKAIATLKLESAWLDGEVVVLDSEGVPSFNVAMALANSGNFAVQSWPLRVNSLTSPFSTRANMR